MGMPPVGGSPQAAQNIYSSTYNFSARRLAILPSGRCSGLQYGKYPIAGLEATQISELEESGLKNSRLAGMN